MTLMTNDSTSPWVNLGRALAAHRIHLGLSKRKAAAAAGFSEATWRQLEEGRRTLAPGHVVEMSARPETIIAAARAVEMDPGLALSIVGLSTESTEALVARMGEMARAAVDEARALIDGSPGSFTQLLRDIADELAGLRREQQRLGDALEQLVAQAPVPPPRVEQPPRRAPRAVTGGSR